MIDEILKRFNLTYEELTSAERETLNEMLEKYQTKPLNIEDLKSYISAMKDQVELELTDPKRDRKQDEFLLARLRNYMLLQSFLTSPDRAKTMVERAIENIAKTKPKIL